MKKFVGALVILSSLWGCGPEQSAYDRDQQQLQAQAAFFKGQIKPYEGNFYGIATPLDSSGNPDPTHAYQTEVVLHIASNELPNAGTTTNTNSINIKGTWGKCLSNKCFGPNKVLGSFPDKSIQLTYSYYDASSGEVIVTSTPLTGCTAATSQICVAVTIRLKWNADHTQLTGSFTVADETDTGLVLTRE